MFKTEKTSIALTTASWLLSCQAWQSWQCIKSHTTADVAWKETAGFRSLGLPYFARQSCPRLKKGVIQTFLPPTPKCIIFLPTPILLVDFRWNFLLICLITAVLIDLITMTATAWIKPECRNKIWERRVMKAYQHDMTVCWYSSLLFTWYPASAKQCTALVLSLITNQN